MADESIIDLTYQKVLVTLEIHVFTIRHYNVYLDVKI